MESRSLFAANAFEVHADFGSSSSQTGFELALLKDGQVAVAGLSNDGKTNTERVAIAVFDSKGALSKSFDSDGTLLLSATDSAKIGQLKDLSQTPDGGLLVIGDTGLLKLKKSGKIDASYGSKGFAGLRATASGTSSDVIQLDNGTSRRTILSAGGKLSLEEFNDKGKLTKSTQRNIGIGGTVDIDARGVQIYSGTKIYRYDAGNLSSVSTFGKAGVLDLKPVIDKWVVKNGPFYDDQVGRSKTVKNPTFTIQGTYDAKSGYAYNVRTTYVTDKVTSTFPTGQGDAYTEVTADVSADGKSVDIVSGRYVSAKFLGSPRFQVTADGSDGSAGFRGVATKSNDARVKASAFPGSEYGVAAEGVFASDGSLYIVGTVNVGGQTAIGLVHTKTL